jgi:hypothetical protein
MKLGSSMCTTVRSIPLNLPHYGRRRLEQFSPITRRNFPRELKRKSAFGSVVSKGSFLDPIFGGLSPPISPRPCLVRPVYVLRRADLLPSFRSHGSGQQFRQSAVEILAIQKLYLY